MIDLNTLEFYFGKIIGLCVIAILLAVFISFVKFSFQKEGKKKITLIDTFTMLLFALLFTVVVRKNIGDFSVEIYWLRLTLMIIGLILTLAGTIFNIYGRFCLSNNWSNQIRVWKKQKLVVTGAYSIVRHPLYASLIWLFFGVSLIYLNWLSLVLNALIFIPMMIVRAKQEEKILGKSFKNHKDYQKEVGMLFPKLKKFREYFERNTLMAVNKLCAAMFLYLAFFLKIPILAIIGALIAIFPLIMTFTNYEQVKYCTNPISRWIKMRFTSEVYQNDINEIRFSLIFGFSVLIWGILDVYLGRAILGYRLILAIAIFKTISGLGFCAGIYLYNLLKYCPICNFKKLLFKKQECKDGSCEIKN
ncbi:MAG: isoprenylcysteine carboxylmethyltransferase family protein [Nanoarchaeota archaeon]